MKLKFGIVGPSGAGKTLIANILGNEMSMDNSIGRPPYRPTNSVRIVEFSVPNVDLRKYNAEVDVQIWEIGGNPRLKSIWPAVQTNLDGIILVYDTNNELHYRDMSALHMHFVTHSNLNPSQCLIIGNQFRGSRDTGPAKIVGVGPRVRHFTVNVDDDPNYLRDEFKHFLTGVAQITTDQDKNPPNVPFMAHPREGEGDGQSRNRRQNQPQFFENYPEQELRQTSPAYYQPYAEFHTARSINKTRNRRDHSGQIVENNSNGQGQGHHHRQYQDRNEADQDFGGFRTVALARDEFSIINKRKE